MSGAAAVRPDMVFYDGGCGLCHRAVRFLVVRDANGSRFVFAPLGGDTFRERIDEAAATTLPDSIVVLTADGDLLVRSRGAIRLLRRLGGPWRLVATLLALMPGALADVAYDLVARIRARLFAKPDEECPVVPPALRGRFMP